MKLRLSFLYTSLHFPGKLKSNSTFKFIGIFAFLFLAFIFKTVETNGQSQLWATTAQGGEDNIGVIGHFDPQYKHWKKDYGFTTKNPGQYPNAGMVEWNGKFYGTTLSGGIENFGIIYEFDPATNSTVTKVGFDYPTKGGLPFGALTLSNGKFYGMTSAGGEKGKGLLYEWDPSTNAFIVLLHFDQINAAQPQGELIVFNGKFYGMTLQGGPSDYGVVFEFDPVSKTTTKRKEFDYNNGANPYGNLVEKDGKLYGMTNSGGENNNGVIFEWDLSANAIVKKIDFQTSTGSHPYGSLSLMNGKFYGTTTYGGTNNLGVIFEWDPTTNTYLKKTDFIFTNGSYCRNLTRVDDKFYGVTSNGGNTSGQGTIFEWNPVSNSITKKFNFSDVNGIYPYGKLVLSDGKLYGTTNGGGHGSSGVIFAWDISGNTFSKRLDFNFREQGARPYSSLVHLNGKYYGMTGEGGSYGYGVIFEYDPFTKVFTKKFDFNKTNGGIPIGAMTHWKGNLYGMTRAGSWGDGVIFQWNPTTNVYTKKFDFISNTTGGLPYGDLVLKDDKFYGTTSDGGASDNGVIFEYDPATNIFTKKHTFDKVNGAAPTGSLTLREGKFYGMTPFGGANSGGVIFSWDPATNIYTKKIDLNSATGNHPYGSLRFYNGKFYGVTYDGGTSGYGTIFEWDHSTNTYTKKGDFNHSNGAHPYGKLLLSGDNKFYVLTRFGGLYGLGGVSEYDPIRNLFQMASSFNGLDGANPEYTSLIDVGIVSTFPHAYISGPSDLCAGSTANLLLQVGGEFPPYQVFYTENGVEKNITTSSTSYTIPVSPTITTTYQLTAIKDADGFRLLLSDQITITVHSSPIAVLSGGESICPNTEAILTVNISGGTSPWVVKYSDGSNTFEYLQSTSEDHIVVTPSSNTTYSLVSVADAFCSGTVSGSATVVVGNILPIVSAITMPSEPVVTNSVVNVSAKHNDDNLTEAAIFWGDGSASEAVLAGDMISGSHVYSMPGLYFITISVRDGCDENFTVTHTEYIIVYDPLAGYVTGSGWFQSRPGDFNNDPRAAGKLHFMFSSAYEAGKSIPSGKTDFHLQGSNLKFKGTAQQWLIVTGYRAVFTGTGELNGMPGYGFLLSVIDGEKINGSVKDKIRIKVWRLSGGTVFDNQPNHSDDAEAITPIGGGSIVINGLKTKGVNESTNEVFAETSGGLSNSAIAYPNPFFNSITVVFPSDTREDVNIQIQDITGKSVYDKSLAFSEAGLYHIDLSHAPTRQMYILKVKQGPRYKALKLLRQ
jgi:uncharacterized repeat protein (TIGR03803 family)